MYPPVVFLGRGFMYTPVIVVASSMYLPGIIVAASTHSNLEELKDPWHAYASDTDGVGPWWFFPFFLLCSNPPLPNVPRAFFVSLAHCSTLCVPFINPSRSLLPGFGLSARASDEDQVAYDIPLAGH
jgi:hypothetical protein